MIYSSFVPVQRDRPDLAEGIGMLSRATCGRVGPECKQRGDNDQKQAVHALSCNDREGAAAMRPARAGFFRTLRTEILVNTRLVFSGKTAASLSYPFSSSSSALPSLRSAVSKPSVNHL
jgi:hypothetical protein